MLVMYICASRGYVSIEFSNMSHEVRRFRLHLYELTFSLGGGGCHVQNLCSRPSDILNTFLIWCHICGEMRRCFFNKTTGLFQLHFKAKHDFFFQTLTWFLCLNLPRYVSNVCANHRYVRCWHLFWTWHITSHDMRISWLPDGGDGAGVITSHEAAGECKVATTRDVVCSFFPSANSPVSSHPAPRCPAGTPSFPLLPSPDIPSPPAHLFPVSPHKPCSILCIYQPVSLFAYLLAFQTLFCRPDFACSTLLDTIPCFISRFDCKKRWSFTLNCLIFWDFTLLATTHCNQLHTLELWGSTAFMGWLA